MINPNVHQPVYGIHDGVVALLTVAMIAVAAVLVYAPYAFH